MEWTYGSITEEESREQKAESRKQKAEGRKSRTQRQKTVARGFGIQLTTGHRPLTTGHRPLTTGHRPLATDHRSLIMKDVRFTKFVIFTNALVPLDLLLWDVFRKRVGATPGEFMTRTTGILTLVFLLLSLAVTPARKITGLNWLVKFRRMLGLFAFFYGFLHLLTYIW